MRVRDIGSFLQAAIDGNGIALGRLLLVADALLQQRLLRLALPGKAHTCSKLQVARWRDPQDQTTERMATWLVLAAGRDMKAGEGTSDSAA